MAPNTLKTDEDTEAQGRGLAKITLKAGGRCGPEPGLSGRIFLLPKLLPLPPPLWLTTPDSTTTQSLSGPQACSPHGCWEEGGQQLPAATRHLHLADL